MYVLDASVIIKWFVEEEYTDKALKFRNQHETGNFELCCPDLTLFEISNVMSFKQDITNKEIYEIITTIFDLEMEIIAPTSIRTRQQ
ncbi:MAG: type II toxin-antitoxin system VapC family toxin [Candidatus Omnitrophica bacterium]|nr:type II toxin-antitoxin system VapC family toxin [Candidatus Omnitrophota bacterium]